MYPQDPIRRFMPLRLFHLSETNLPCYYKIVISIADARTARDLGFFFTFFWGGQGGGDGITSTEKFNVWP